MSETIVQKVNKLSLFSGGPTGSSPSNKDYIKKLDYQALERQFHIHKYYPSEIHNEVSTPTLRNQLQDTPIYAKANKSVKHECKASKMKFNNRRLSTNSNPYKKPTKFDSQQANGFDHLVPIAARKHKNDFNHEKQDGTHVHQNEFIFHNPFDDTKIIHPSGAGPKSSKRHNSIASRMLHFVRGDTSQKSDRTQMGVPLHRSTTFDQTKSDMTSNRHRKSIFPKLKQSHVSRRGSEQLGMYFILLTSNNCNT